MFKQKKYIFIMTVVCTMFLFVVPVSASMVDDGGNNSQQETYHQYDRGNWWDFFYHCFPSYEKQQILEQNESTNNDEVVQDEPEEEIVDNEVNEIEKPSAEEQTDLLAFEQEVVELTNVEREKYQLQPLQVDGTLSKVAREKSKDMRVNRYFDHQSPVYGSPFDMMQQFGVTYRTAGENIAMGQRSPQEVVQAWMNSEGHRANILNPNFTHIGVGFDENGNYWTQQFIGK